MTLHAKGIAVKYTGKEAPFIDRNYHSALRFDHGQTRIVPVELAERLLRHADVFAPGELADAEAVTVPAADDTQTALKLADKQKAEQAALDNQRQDVVDQINIMDKEALKDYAHVKYGQPLPKTLSVENMRAKVVGLIDQYGLI